MPEGYMLYLQDYMESCKFLLAFAQAGAPVRRGKDSSSPEQPAKRRFEMPVGCVRVRVMYQGRSIDDFTLHVESSFAARELPCYPTC